MPLRGKTKKEVLTEFRHAEILEAARKVFAEKGFGEASVEDIARAAGVAKGTLYLYYPSKRDIYWGALKSGLESLSDLLDSRMGSAGSTEAKVRAFMRTKLDYFELHRDFFKIYYAEFGHALVQSTCFYKDFEEYHFRQVRLVTAALREGTRRGTLRKLPVEMTALAIVNLTRGVIVQRLLGWTGIDMERDVEFLFDLVWKGIAAR
jgi:AcrR family transcriptional regulator